MLIESIGARSKIVETTIRHLKHVNPDKVYFHYKSDIGEAIAANWDYLRPGEDKDSQWLPTVAAVLSTSKDIFKSGTEEMKKSGFWTTVSQATPSDMTHIRRIQKFNMDNWIKRYLWPPTTAMRDTSDSDNNVQPITTESKTVTPYEGSMLSRIMGNCCLSYTLTTPQPRFSLYSGKQLLPFIMRDYQAKPIQKLILEAMCDPPKGGSAPIDYVYLHAMHMTAVNGLLRDAFWPDIDVSESLAFPDFSIVALYKRLVVGCAFMMPDGYITYFHVRKGWERAGIGSSMLFHLIQKASSTFNDVTLHVSANNPAMLLYQRFGFKAEGFFVDFYSKYYPSDSNTCKNAFFLRLRLR